MIRKQAKKWIKPTTTDVGRGEELRKIPFQRGAGDVFLLPPDGAEVPWDSSPEGLFWKRGLGRKEVEPCEPKQRLERSPAREGKPASPEPKAETKTTAKKEQSHV